MREGYRLGDHCLKIGSGATPRGGKETYLETGPVALIRSQNIYNDRFSYSGLAYISEHQAAQLRNVIVEPEDVLLNITGDSVARVCQVDSRVLPARVNQHVAIIRPDPDVIDAQYLRCYLGTPSFQGHMLALAASGATRNALTKGMIEEFRVPRTPISEQRAIASILGALDDKIDLNRRMSETLEAMARALFKDWFVDFSPTRAKMEGREPYLAPDLWALFPDRLDEEGKPEGWEVVPADVLVHFNPRERLAKGANAPFLEMAALPTSGPTTDEPSLRPFTSGSKFRRADTLLARITPSLENGKTAFVQDLDEGAVGWGSTEFVVMRAKAPLPPEYAYLLARHDVFREVAIQSMTGTSGRQRAQVESLTSFPVIAPPAEVAAAFGSLVPELFSRIGANTRQSRTLAQTRDLLLPKLMSGEIRVRDAERMVEDVV